MLYMFSGEHLAFPCGWVLVGHQLIMNYKGGSFLADGLQLEIQGQLPFVNPTSRDIKDAFGYSKQPFPNDTKI